MALKNFSRHMPKSHDRPRKKEDRSGGDRLMGAVGEGAKYAALGSKFGPWGTAIGGTLGTVKGFFGTPEGKGAESLMGGAAAATDAAVRSAGAAKKLKAKANQGGVGKVRKGSKDGFLKKGDVITRAKKQDPDDFEDY